MKKHLLGVIVLAFLFACSSNPSPKKTAELFLTNFFNGNISEIEEHTTESTFKILEFASSLGDMEAYPDFEFNFIRDSIVGNKAWVYFGDDEDESVIELIKIDNKWLVHIDDSK